MIIDRIRMEIPVGMCIPKPMSKERYHVVRWGTSRGEEALVYRIPSKPGTKSPSEKRITVSAFEKSYRELTRSNQFTYAWFERNLPDTKKDGSCNFTTIGGIFELLGEAEYSDRETYTRKRR